MRTSATSQIMRPIRRARGCPSLPTFASPIRALPTRRPTAFCVGATIIRAASQPPANSTWGSCSSAFSRTSPQAFSPCNRASTANSSRNTSSPSAADISSSCRASSRRTISSPKACCAPRRSLVATLSPRNATSASSRRHPGLLDLRKVGAARRLLPSIHLLDDGIDLLARSPQRVRSQKKVDRRLFGPHQLEDRLRGSIWIADLLAGHRVKRGQTATNAGGIGCVLRVRFADRMAGEKISPERARRHRRHLDAERANFLRETRRQALESIFGGRVKGGSGDGRASGYRRDVDDMARTLGAQVWQSRANDAKWSEHVDFEQPSRIGVGGFLQ